MTDWKNKIHCGDAIETLQELPESSIHCSVTSPPYFGLRDYNAEGQIGLEETVDEYVEAIGTVGDEIKRVLRSDGSWWLNLGDSFAGSGRGQWDENEQQKEAYTPDTLPEQRDTLRRKSKMLVPHRVAIELQNRGWIVRSDAVWYKTNPMPHPVKDRFNEHKEFLFHLVPEPDYWFDLDAVRESHKNESFRRVNDSYETAGLQAMACPDENRDEEIRMNAEAALHPNGKNPGDIIEASSSSGVTGHFAVFPRALCERPIKSSCPPTVCSSCGSPYERVTEETQLWERDIDSIDRRQSVIALERFQESDLTVEHLIAARAVGFGDGAHGDASQGSRDRVNDRQRRLSDEAKDVLGGYFREFVASPEREVTGWDQACTCETDETEPGVVLDPFAGSGTSCLVAKDLGRQFVGIDLNPDYVAMAQERIGIDVSEPERLGSDDMTLRAFTDGGTDGENPCCPGCDAELSDRITWDHGIKGADGFVCDNDDCPEDDWSFEEWFDAE